MWEKWNFFRCAFSSWLITSAISQLNDHRSNALQRKVNHDGLSNLRKLNCWKINLILNIFSLFSLANNANSRAVCKHFISSHLLLLIVVGYSIIRWLSKKKNIWIPLHVWLEIFHIHRLSLRQIHEKSLTISNCKSLETLKLETHSCHFMTFDNRRHHRHQFDLIK